MFVAPVRMGDEAYTAAGSVITKDVPPGALGVARERQQNVDGYARRRAEREAATKGEGGAEREMVSNPEAAEQDPAREQDKGDDGS
jgi:bifunctional UDP-N-acetylglucosamine pyrophosphorylase/glucosamine-1-phosphate N-acetyltransferase